jgi:hypothetical protein
MNGTVGKDNAMVVAEPLEFSGIARQRHSLI